ncbi:type I restriction-modification system subunit M N-terminal domain-containing protein [Corynebacterium belfantii]|uniref:type I restriction-modification system subunit M N-terminal domain-containing protein n=1 Tax=Corynebacterium belfantii TaxID=2014537 RepID=UPI000A4ECE56|nr:type I restriction-modification system subunit M N-terminal domain-containing protein [Corynebacterium belfantii]SNW32882.1 hypothetical protein FRC0043_02486 [Corynebacterium belfantii]STC65938.1 type I restriction-modification system, M subunit [Corynebacterium diphtheriae]
MQPVAALKLVSGIGSLLWVVMLKDKSYIGLFGVLLMIYAGSVDGWDFKQYVLGMLFYRFISERFVQHVNRLERETDPDFDYVHLPDDLAEYGRDSSVAELGFFHSPVRAF